MLFLNRCTAASKPEGGVSGKKHNKERYKLSTCCIWNFVSRCSALRETSPSSRRILDAFVCCGCFRGSVTTRLPNDGRPRQAHLHALLDAALRQLLQGAAGVLAVAHVLSSGRDRHSARRKPY